MPPSRPAAATRLPLHVRQDHQRRRLFAAAARVFARIGYAEATAEAIAREAGMSKATFYEHFDNKEDCIVALFDAAIEVVIAGMRAAGEANRDADPATRIRVTAGAFFDALTDVPRRGADAAGGDRRRRPARDGRAATRRWTSWRSTSTT